MYKTYTCQECGQEFRLHGQDVPRVFAEHYEAKHPKIYECLQKLANAIRELQAEFRSYHTHTIPEMIR
jgi:hypothetical protein